MEAEGQVRLKSPSIVQRSTVDIAFACNILLCVLPLQSHAEPPSVKRQGLEVIFEALQYHDTWRNCCSC